MSADSGETAPLDHTTNVSSITNRPIRRRRRRVLSCERCRKLKCRCAWESSQRACLRCRTLKLDCVKPTDGDYVAGSPASTSQTRTDAALARAEHLISDGMLDGVSTKSPSPKRGMLQSSNLDPNEDMAHVSSIGQPTVDLVDGNVHASPAEVIRRVGRQLHGGQRRTFDHGQDLFLMDVLDEDTANKLIKISLSRLRQTLIVWDDQHLSDGLHITSPFLHAVCCLMGIRWTNATDNRTLILHREVYERVRRSLGELMLVTPLATEELTGIFIMSLFATSPTQGPEYIDSWLLSGHCAHQAMLSFSFTGIASRINSETANSSDHKTIRLWANICLVNIQWAAVTGRPPNIPETYLRQYKLLLDFDQATMRDGMLVAELELYTLLHEHLLLKRHMNSDGGSEQITAWESERRHLFNLPASGKLNLSRAVVWLLLARRAVEAPKNPSSPRVSHETVNHSEPSPDVAEQTLYDSALRLIHSFLSLGDATKQELPEFHFNCLAYSLLVLSKYAHKSPVSARRDVCSMLEDLNVFCRASPLVSAAVSFALERTTRQFAYLLKD